MEQEENCPERIIKIIHEELESIRLNQRLANDFFIESLIQGERSSYTRRANSVLYKNN